MGSTRGVASEFRANLLDCLAYVLPGGLLLLVIAAAACPRVSVEFCWGACAKCREVWPECWGALEALESFWFGLLFASALFAVCYALGTVIHAIDSLHGPKWTEHVRKAELESRLLGDAITRWARRQQGWSYGAGCSPTVGCGRREQTEVMTETQEIHNLAQSIVPDEAPELHALEQRYEALSDFNGHLAWVALLGPVSFVLTHAPDPPRFAVGLLALVAFAMAGPGGSAQDGRVRWTGRIVALAGLLVLLLGAPPWLWLATGAGALAFFLLKHRQFSLRVMRVKFVWSRAVFLRRSGE